MVTELNEVYYRTEIPPSEETITFTGHETAEELRQMLRESDGVYQTMLIKVELRTRGFDP